jgi:hypothetical protein
MQATNAITTAPTDFLISGLLSQKPDMSEHQLSKRAISVFSQFGNMTSTVCEKSEHWHQLLSLGLDFNLPHELIAPLLEEKSSRHDILTFCSSLMNAIADEMEAFKSELNRIWSMTEKQLSQVMEFGGELSITDLYDDVGENVPQLHIELTTNQVIEVFGKNISSENQRMLQHLINYVGCHGLFSSSECLMDRELYYYESIAEYIDDTGVKILSQINLNQFNEKSAESLLNDVLTDEHKSNIADETGCESLSEFGCVLILIMLKTHFQYIDERKEKKEFTLDIMEQSLKRDFTSSQAKTDKLKDLFKLTRLLKTDHQDEFNENADDVYSHFLFRQVISFDAHYQLTSNVVEDAMQSGVWVYMPLAATTKISLMSTLKNYYLGGYITVAMNQLFDSKD